MLHAVTIWQRMTDVQTIRIPPGATAAEVYASSSHVVQWSTCACGWESDPVSFPDDAPPPEMALTCPMAGREVLA